MQENIKKFLVEVSRNEDLKKEFVAKIKEQGEEASAALIKLAVQLAEFANEKGFDVDVQNVLLNTIKVDDENLEEIAGGRYRDVTSSADNKTYLVSDCICYAGGGGTKDEWQKTCACVLGGCGELTDKGKKRAAEDPMFIKYGAKGAPVAMWCAICGHMLN